MGERVRDGGGEPPSYLTTPERSIPGAASDPAVFRDQITDYLAVRREQGQRYVTAAEIADEFDVIVQKVASNLPQLVEAGVLEEWGEKQYRIVGDVRESGRQESEP